MKCQRYETDLENYKITVYTDNNKKFLFSCYPGLPFYIMCFFIEKWRTEKFHPDFNEIAKSCCKLDK